MTEWIACCDRVPEPWTQVLCISAQGRMFVGEFLGITKTGKYNFSTVTCDNRLATHWTALPDAPEIPRSLSITELDILKAMVKAGAVQSQAARVCGMTTCNVNYHMKRILEITGKDPRNPKDLKELADKYLG